MSGVPFSGTAEEQGQDVVLKLRGDINRSAQQGLSDLYESVGAGSGRLVLDFSDVAYINSTGIALIVGLLAQARAGGREVEAYGLTDHYREIFHITRLSDFMTIRDQDESAAVAASE